MRNGEETEEQNPLIAASLADRQSNDFQSISITCCVGKHTLITSFNARET